VGLERLGLWSVAVRVGESVGSCRASRSGAAGRVGRELAG
jgi:hypothetical protein